jgi:hypothetical protein
MKNKSIFWGISLVAIGIILLLKTLGIISFQWKDLIKLWPLILIWIGICIMPIKDIFKIILNIIVFAIGIYILVVGNPFL